jgi:two-component system chemotaxis sensor kinase CheA
VLEARAEDQHVTVEVRDDGRGIDRTRVERKALERGLLEPREKHGDEDLWRCLFTPGFTTRDRATELSGRGIGLDVVRRAVLTLQGLVEIVSTPGVGTRVLLRLPQSLTVTRGLVARLGDALVAFPLHSIVGVRALGDRPAKPSGGRARAAGRRDEAVPVLDLARYFALPGRADRPSRRSIVLAGVAEKRMGIVVERIVSQEELLVRPLGALLAGHRGLSGVAELAGGELAFVIDIPALVALLDCGGPRPKGAS